MENTSTKRIIISFIQNAEFGKGIELLIDEIEETQPQLLSEVSLFKIQYKEIKRSDNLGLMTQNEVMVARNKLSYQILIFVNKNLI